MISADNSGFFLNRPPKKLKLKLKTQAKNSKKKPQLQGGSFLPSRKTQGKNWILRIFLKKLKGLGSTFCVIHIVSYSRSDAEFHTKFLHDIKRNTGSETKCHTHGS